VILLPERSFLEPVLKFVARKQIWLVDRVTIRRSSPLWLLR